MVAPGQLTRKEKYKGLSSPDDVRDFSRDVQRDLESLRSWMSDAEATYLPLAGGTMGGNLGLNGNSLSNVGNIVDATDITRDVAMAGLVEDPLRQAYIPTAGSNNFNVTFQLAYSRLQVALMPTAVNSFYFTGVKIPDPVLRYGTSHTLTITIYWYPDDTNTNQVQFQLIFFNPDVGGSASTVASALSLNVFATPGGTSELIQANSNTSVVTNWTTLPEGLHMRISRLGSSDTYTGGARIVLVVLQWNGDFAT